MKNLKSLLKELKNEVVDQFTQIRKDYPTIDLIKTDEDLSNEDEYFEEIEEYTGKSIDIRIIGFNSSGIKIVREGDEISDFKYIGIKDLASIDYQVRFLEKIRSFIVNN